MPGPVPRNLLAVSQIRRLPRGGGKDEICPTREAGLTLKQAPSVLLRLFKKGRLYQPGHMSVLQRGKPGPGGAALREAGPPAQVRPEGNAGFLLLLSSGPPPRPPHPINSGATLARPASPAAPAQSWGRSSGLCPPWRLSEAQLRPLLTGEASTRAAQRSAEPSPGSECAEWAPGSSWHCETSTGGKKPQPPLPPCRQGVPPREHEAALPGHSGVVELVGLWA